MPLRARTGYIREGADADFKEVVATAFEAAGYDVDRGTGEIRRPDDVTRPCGGCGHGWDYHDEADGLGRECGSLELAGECPCRAFVEPSGAVVPVEEGAAGDEEADGGLGEGGAGDDAGSLDGAAGEGEDEAEAGEEVEPEEEHAGSIAAAPTAECGRCGHERWHHEAFDFCSTSAGCTCPGFVANRQLRSLVGGSRVTGPTGEMFEMVACEIGGAEALASLRNVVTREVCQVPAESRDYALVEKRAVGA